MVGTSFVFNEVKRKPFQPLTAPPSTDSVLMNWVAAANGDFKIMLNDSLCAMNDAALEQGAKDADSLGPPQSNSIRSLRASPDGLDEATGANYIRLQTSGRTITNPNGGIAQYRSNTPTEGAHTAATNGVTWTSLGNSSSGRQAVGLTLYRNTTGIGTLVEDDSVPMVWMFVGLFSPGGATITINFNTNGIFQAA